MAITLNGGTGVITGVSVGGLADGVVDSGTLATNSVDSAEVIDGAVDTSHLATATRGKVVQVVHTHVTAHVTGTTVSVRDGSIPQITEGNEVMTLAITPTSTSNKLLVHVIALGNASHANRNMTMALFNTDVHSTNAISTTGWLSENTDWEITNPLVHYLTAPTTSETTFRVRLGSHTTGTSMINGFGSTQLYAGTAGSTMTIWEIAV